MPFAICSRRRYVAAASFARAEDATVRSRSASSPGVPAVFPVPPPVLHPPASPLRPRRLLPARRSRPRSLELCLEPPNLGQPVGELPRHPGDQLVDRLRYPIPIELFVEVVQSF